MVTLQIRVLGVHLIAGVTSYAMAHESCCYPRFIPTTLELADH